MAAVLDDGGGDIVEVVRRHDGVDGVGLFALEHLAIIGVAALDLVLVAGFVQTGFVEIGDGDELGSADVVQGGVMGRQRAAAGADHGDAEFFGSGHGVLRMWTGHR